MSGRRLSGNVWIRSDGGVDVFYPRGSEEGTKVAPEHAAQIGDHLWASPDQVEPSEAPAYPQEITPLGHSVQPVIVQPDGSLAGGVTDPSRDNSGWLPDPAPEVLEALDEPDPDGGDLIDEASTAPLPRQAGPGSSLTAWVAYAEANGVTVAADAKRDDVIAALEEAGVPTK